MEEIVLFQQKSLSPRSKASENVHKTRERGVFYFSSNYSLIVFRSNSRYYKNERAVSIGESRIKKGQIHDQTDRALDRSQKSGDRDS